MFLIILKDYINIYYYSKIIKNLLNIRTMINIIWTYFEIEENY